MKQKLFLIVFTLCTLFFITGCSEGEKFAQPQPSEIITAINKQKTLKQINAYTEDTTKLEITGTSEIYKITRTCLQNFESKSPQFLITQNLETNMPDINGEFYIAYKDGYIYKQYKPANSRSEKTKVDLSVKQLEKQYGVKVNNSLLEHNLYDLKNQKSGENTLYRFKVKDTVLFPLNSDKKDEIFKTFNCSDITGEMTVNSEGFIIEQRLKFTLTGKSSKQASIVEYETYIKYHDVGKAVTISFPTELIA